MQAEKKEIQFGAEAQAAMKKGIDILCNAVKSTLGPKGRYVVYRDKSGRPHATKDGVTIAKEVELFDPIERLGADMVREASEKAAEISGDGTTTATVLAQAMVEEGYKLIKAGINPVDITRGMDKGVSQVLVHLDKISKPITAGSDQLHQVALVSSNGDTSVAELVSEAYALVGANGVVTAEISKDGVTSTEVTKGVKVNSGFAHRSFMTDLGRKHALLENPFIILYDDKIESFNKQLLPVLDSLFSKCEAEQVDPPSVVIFAADFDQEVTATLLANKYSNGFKLLAVKLPNFGEMRDEIIADISATTGAKIVSKRAGDSLERTEVESLGRAEKVVSGYHDTVIVGGEGPNLETHIASLMALPQDQYVKERISLLTGGVATIKVGGMTEVEVKEKKDRVDDAIGAVKSAIEEGVVVGGGAALVRASEVVICNTESDEEALGIRLIKKAIQAPMKTIVENTGKSGDVAIYQMGVFDDPDAEFGYDARSEKIVNMHAAGILDPKKVTRVALESAVSVAKVILTTDCAMGDFQ